MATTKMTVKFTPNDKGNPPGKLADAELHFADGPLDGMKLIGFSIWETRTGARRNVTFPARQYSVNGERRSFALLRPISDTAAPERIRELVLEAYASYEEELARTSWAVSAGAPSLALRRLRQVTRVHRVEPRIVSEPGEGTRHERSGVAPHARLSIRFRKITQGYAQRGEHG